MDSPEEITKFACLDSELETAISLLKSGFGALQEIDMANDFYHLPYQLLASGFERLMKCYIILVYRSRHGSYPDTLKGLGHNLEELLKEICDNYYGGKSRPLVQQEFEFVTKDSCAKDCIRILSVFGIYGRYYNLDVVTGSTKKLIDPRAEWEELENRVEDRTPYVDDMESLHWDYYPRVNATLIATMERVARAIAYQFTLGDHGGVGSQISTMSIRVSHFRRLKDEQLGTTDYRRSVKLVEQRRDKWVHRSEEEILNGKWPTRVVAREEFDGEWPFRKDRVIVENQEKMFCIVYIEGYAFALNGAAASHKGLPMPHDAGLAVLGRSIGPFIQMAQNLSG